MRNGALPAARRRDPSGQLLGQRDDGGAATRRPQAGHPRGGPLGGAQESLVREHGARRHGAGHVHVSCKRLAGFVRTTRSLLRARVEAARTGESGMPRQCAHAIYAKARITAGLRDCRRPDVPYANPHTHATGQRAAGFGVLARWTLHKGLCRCMGWLPGLVLQARGWGWLEISAACCDTLALTLWQHCGAGWFGGEPAWPGPGMGCAPVQSARLCEPPNIAQQGNSPPAAPPFLKPACGSGCTHCACASLTQPHAAASHRPAPCAPCLILSCRRARVQRGPQAPRRP